MTLRVSVLIATVIAAGLMLSACSSQSPQAGPATGWDVVAPGQVALQQTAGSPAPTGRPVSLQAAKHSLAVFLSRLDAAAAPLVSAKASATLTSLSGHATSAEAALRSAAAATQHDTSARSCSAALQEAATAAGLEQTLVALSGQAASLSSSLQAAASATLQDVSAVRSAMKTIFEDITNTAAAVLPGYTGVILAAQVNKDQRLTTLANAAKALAAHLQALASSGSGISGHASGVANACRPPKGG